MDFGPKNSTVAKLYLLRVENGCKAWKRKKGQSFGEDVELKCSKFVAGYVYDGASSAIVRPI